MGAYRLPRVMCRMFDAVAIDAGTLCRAASAAPGTLSDEKLPEPQPEQQVFVDPDFEDITESVDNGFCVPLVQLSTDVGNTGRWRAGAALKSHPDLKPGTVIATFNAKGRYESKARGNHAAFFVEYATRDGHAGIVIYDQYREWAPKEGKGLEAAYPEVDEKHGRFRRKQPGRRFIAFDRKGNPSNDASAYSVVTH